jgi:hypothetical protein
LIWINAIFRIVSIIATDQLIVANGGFDMHVEDRQMGSRVGYTVLVLVGLMVCLIIAANFIA